MLNSHIIVIISTFLSCYC